MPGELIVIDWGTTSFRAYRVGDDGEIVAQVAAPQGILSVADKDFDAALERHIGEWDTAIPVLAAGMITSRQGWIELPYVPCPAGIAELAKHIHHMTTRRGRRIAFATGLSYRSPDGIPDVMRSEETQVLGALEGDSGFFVTPGTHSKWVEVSGGLLTRYTTYTSGEVFAALKDHTILGRLMTGETGSEAAFERGVRAALKDPAGFLHRIFSVRSLGLFSEMATDDLASYLSGQVIGTEIAHAMQLYPAAASYTVLASPGIGDRYVKAMTIAGLSARRGDPLAIVKGLLRIGKAAGLVQRAKG
jgi:2-dehydro-3-deoxygalactonokinase